MPLESLSEGGNQGFMIYNLRFWSSCKFNNLFGHVSECQNFFLSPPPPLSCAKRRSLIHSFCFDRDDLFKSLFGQRGTTAAVSSDENAVGR